MSREYGEQKLLLLLIFALNFETRFDALASLEEGFALGFLFWRVEENSGDVGAQERNYVREDLKKKKKLIFEFFPPILYF